MLFPAKINKHIVRDITIRYSPYTTSMEVQAQTLDIENIQDFKDAILVQVVEDSDVLNELTDTELYNLSTKVRSASYGSEVEMTYTCSCGSVQSAQLDLEEDVMYSDATLETFLLDASQWTNEELRLEVTLTGKRTEAIIKASSDYPWIAHIKTIKVQEEQQDFNFKELQAFIDSLPLGLFKALEEHVQQRTGTCYIEKEVNCFNCNLRSNLTLEPSFFFLAL